jgi:hypothetical protein
MAKYWETIGGMAMVVGSPTGPVGKRPKASKDWKTGVAREVEGCGRKNPGGGGSIGIMAAGLYSDGIPPLPTAAAAAAAAAVELANTKGTALALELEGGRGEKCGLLLTAIVDSERGRLCSGAMPPGRSADPASAGEGKAGAGAAAVGVVLKVDCGLAMRGGAAAAAAVAAVCKAKDGMMASAGATGEALALVVGAGGEARGDATKDGSMVVRREAAAGSLPWSRRLSNPPPFPPPPLCPHFLPLASNDRRPAAMNCCGEVRTLLVAMSLPCGWRVRR